MPDFKKAIDLQVTPRSTQMIDKEDLKYLATKQDLEDLRGELGSEIRDLRNEVFNRLDEVLTVVKRMDQERIFTFEYVKRLETDVDKNSRQIERIKDVLKIS
jgi:hypothetical protein